MTFEEKKREYAKLIVKAGVHLRKGQKVYLTCPIEQYEFARLVIEEAYKEGALAVLPQYADDVTKRFLYEYAPLDYFKTVPEWKVMERNALSEDDTAFIHLIGSDPEAFKGVDLEKLKTERITFRGAFEKYYHHQAAMDFKWTIEAVPTLPWARSLFPELSDEEAMAKLWEAIFICVRIGEGDAYEKWMNHSAEMKAKTEKLNQWKLRELHYRNSLGTDFTVGLVDNNIWEGVGDKDPVDGGVFFANMPTEEAFTMPHRLKAEGVLKAALPLSYNGDLIEDFSLTFKEGKVVDYSAKKGYETLKSLLECDEGSLHLGEVALVPKTSPVRKSGLLFKETLFDENAACHFALGDCYTTNVKGGTEMSEEELKELGGNSSANHVDFMVGTDDLQITGVTAAGETVQIFKDGTWAF